jgi:RNA polymerase sigma-70 factor (ECF subfamily)
MKWRSPGEPGADAGGRANGPGAAVDFSAQFSHCFRALWLIATGILRDAHRAEDAVQEAAIIGYRKLNEFQPNTSFRAWMGQIVRNVALNAARREKRRRTADLDQAATPPVARRDGSGGLSRESDGNVSVNPDEFDDKVVRALDGLSQEARTCLLLRVIEDVEYSEIASMLGIPEGTAMSHVFRARKQLREQLQGDFPAWAGKIGGVA